MCDKCRKESDDDYEGDVVGGLEQMAQMEVVIRGFMIVL
jgi:hypothetical protein